MIQDIIVLLIILAAVSYTIYAVVKAVTTKKNPLCGDCFACSIPELTKQKNTKKKALKRMEVSSK